MGAKDRRERSLSYITICTCGRALQINEDVLQTCLFYAAFKVGLLVMRATVNKNLYG
jgi:hypothetical protein